MIGSRNMLAIRELMKLWVELLSIITMILYGPTFVVTRMVFGAAHPIKA